MTKLRKGSIESNRSFAAGTIITEVHYQPTLVRHGNKKVWEYYEKKQHFEIVEVGRREYRCQYLGAEGRAFYWPFWDKQPHHGFAADGATVLRYYIGKIE
jgi:hypothetical protein